MNLNRIKPGTIALFVGGAMLLGVGTYTENGGFQLAGAMLIVVAAITAINQARRSGDAE